MNATQQQFEQCASQLKLLAKNSDTTADYVQLAVCADRMHEAARGHARYEALRVLNPQQFAELWSRALLGRNFDELVDELVKAKNELK